MEEGQRIGKGQSEQEEIKLLLNWTLSLLASINGGIRREK